MYQDDHEAMQQLAASATQEAERLRRENAAMRQAVGRMNPSQLPLTMAYPATFVYSGMDIRSLPLEERARLANHGVRRFPVWLVGILNVLTMGLFPLIHFGLLHDRLPKAAHNDPSSGKAIGYQFIPYYNLYWIFFSALRLSDRLTLQFRLRGLPDRAPRGLLIAACVVTLIPYVNLVIAFPILWTIAVCLLQASVNRVADLDPNVWDAAPSDAPSDPAALGAPQAYRLPAQTSEQIAAAARAKKLVGWSQVLGWGGLAMLVVGSPVAFGVGGPVAAGVVGGTMMIAVVAGAVVGQIGRALQGRAI